MNPHAAAATPMYPLNQGDAAPGQPQGSSVVHYTTVNVAPEPPRDHIVWSICCLLYSNPFCLGLVALIFSVKARDRKLAGDLEGARYHGRIACILNIISTVLVSILTLALIIVMAVAIHTTTAYYNHHSYGK
ncbi:dispanin subfamily A member 2b-like [Salarias fasciatus]|uniref:Dispanin subfamily A member 2b-like n=1 Tax=Salarias fasciatus TaxID=181472 RepID=A0A672JGB4_SALFA|nr:dispanin subfamily A member 2b-like [Salarias fasciatus]